MNMQPGGAAELGFVIPLTKIDLDRRLVYGIAAVEEPDKSREIFDYASSKPYMQKWSEGIHAASGGLSKGNLRSMHQKTAIGRFDSIDFDDDKKMVKVCAHVVDDQEWKKVQAGVYTGFSVGGGYAKSWQDPTGLKRYTADVREISLVDNPCMPSARIAELVKGDFGVGQLELRGAVHTFAEAWSNRSVQPATFGEAWDERLQTFGQLTKAYDEAKHKRSHGKFASAATSVGSAVATAQAVGGGALFGAGIGGQIGLGDAVFGHRFGTTGKQGFRNATAHELRNRRGKTREQIKQNAREYRAGAEGVYARNTANEAAVHEHTSLSNGPLSSHRGVVPHDGRAAAGRAGPTMQSHADRAGERAFGDYAAAKAMKANVGGVMAQMRRGRGKFAVPLAVAGALGGGYAGYKLDQGATALGHMLERKWKQKTGTKDVSTFAWKKAKQGARAIGHGMGLN